MKNFIYIFSISCFILAGCQDKITVPLPLPNATFTVEINDNNVAFFNFNLNEGEVYTLDFGDGSTYTDSLIASNMNKSPSIGHEYKTNGQFLTTLSIKSITGIDKKQITVNANNAVIADFSYEILENGKVRFKNLSQNAMNHKWSITHYSTSFINYPNYISSDKDININVDLSGYYHIRLDVTGKGTKSIQKIINVTNLKKQMEFSGYYKGVKVSGSLESNKIGFYSGFASLFQFGLSNGVKAITNRNDSLQITDDILTKFYPLFPLEYNKQIYSYGYQQAKYLALKKYLTSANDPDIIEVTEEDLDPLFYNNTDQFYPKAFWVKYKVKNEVLDGELKVRIMVYGVK